MAGLYGSTHLKAWHTNFPRHAPSSPLLPLTHTDVTACRGEPLSLMKNPLLYLQHLFTPYTAFEKAGLAHTAWFERWGRGYFGVQATRPQTLGYALEDSPAGLLAWVYEKLVQWSDGYAWADDEGTFSVPLVEFICGADGAHEIHSADVGFDLLVLT
jgi:hypothetical protein